MKKSPFYCFLVLSLFLPVLSNANNTVSGVFVAKRGCPAYQSLEGSINPDYYFTKRGSKYDVLEKNSNNTYYKIHSPGAFPPERWVYAACGTFIPSVKSYEDLKKYILALNWQPAFCQTHKDKKECLEQTEENYDASHFTFQGLWPQPKNNIYCNVNAANIKLDKENLWTTLPSLNIAKETSEEITLIMPGANNGSLRHEWYKYGSCCMDNSPEDYFQIIISLIKQINSSSFQKFFLSNIGKEVSIQKIKNHFNTDFGKGAGEKMSIYCNEKGMISEIFINLTGKITTETPLISLIEKADPTDSNCNSGIIDKVGF